MQVFNFLQGWKTHLIVLGLITPVITGFLAGEIALGAAIEQVLQYLAISTFKAGVDRGLASS